MRKDVLVLTASVQSLRAAPPVRGQCQCLVSRKLLCHIRILVKPVQNAFLFSLLHRSSALTFQNENGHFYDFSFFFLCFDWITTHRTVLAGTAVSPHRADIAFRYSVRHTDNCADFFCQAAQNAQHISVHRGNWLIEAV